MARLTPNTLNTAAAVYLVSRVAYNLIYINNTSSTFSLDMCFQKGCGR